jgi:sensor histidine kinase YesM
MLNFKHISIKKYIVIECMILFFLCYVRPIISDLEYSAYEQKDIRRFSEDIEARIVWGTFSFVFLSVYYFAFLKKLVMANRHWLVVITLPLFVFLYHLFDFYIQDRAIVSMNFLSEKFRSKTNARLQRNNLYFTFNYLLSYSYIPLVGMAYIARFFKQQQLISKLKEQQLMSELKYLKDKLHPHFFFNTLNNIYVLAIQGSERTAPMVAGLSDLMRYMLYESDQPAVPLKREVAILHEYISLEKIRYGERFNISFEVQGVKENDVIPPLLLLPFIENAFKHGLQDAVDQGYVDIIVCRTDNELLMKVKNSTVKLPVTEPGGIGLSTVQQRLNLLYGNDYSLDMVAMENTYEVILSLKMDA